MDGATRRVVAFEEGSVHYHAPDTAWMSELQYRPVVAGFAPAAGFPAISHVGAVAGCDQVGHVAVVHIVTGKRSTTTRHYTDPDVGWARQLNLGAFAIYVVNGDGDVTAQGFSGDTDVLLNNLGRMKAAFLHFGRRTDDLESFGNGPFTVTGRWEFHTDYFSDFSRPFSYRLGVDLNEEKVHGVAIKARVGVEWRPSQRMKINLLAQYVRRDGWLLHQGEDNFTTFDTREWRPTLGVDFFFTARQQLRLSAQWVGIQARERNFFKVPDDGGELVPGGKPPDGASDDFTISNLNVQLRYRWELAPLSDLFLVYTINGLKEPSRASFSKLLRTAYEDPVSEKIVVKLRYRFGS